MWPSLDFLSQRQKNEHEQTQSLKCLSCLYCPPLLRSVFLFAPCCLSVTSSPSVPFLSLQMIIQNITDLALVAGLAEKLINANSKCYRNYTFGVRADTEKE